MLRPLQMLSIGKFPKLQRLPRFQRLLRLLPVTAFCLGAVAAYAQTPPEGTYVVRIEGDATGNPHGQILVQLMTLNAGNDGTFADNFSEFIDLTSAPALGVNQTNLVGRVLQAAARNNQWYESAIRDAVVVDATGSESKYIAYVFLNNALGQLMQLGFNFSTDPSYVPTFIKKVYPFYVSAISQSRLEQLLFVGEGNAIGELDINGQINILIPAGEISAQKYGAIQAIEAINEYPTEFTAVTHGGYFLRFKITPQNDVQILNEFYFQAGQNLNVRGQNGNHLSLSLLSVSPTQVHYLRPPAQLLSTAERSWMTVGAHDPNRANSTKVYAVSFNHATGALDQASLIWDRASTPMRRVLSLVSPFQLLDFDDSKLVTRTNVALDYVTAFQAPQEQGTHFDYNNLRGLPIPELEFTSFPRSGKPWLPRSFGGVLGKAAAARATSLNAAPAKPNATAQDLQDAESFILRQARVAGSVSMIQPVMKLDRMIRLINTTEELRKDLVTAVVAHPLYKDEMSFWLDGAHRPMIGTVLSSNGLEYLELKPNYNPNKDVNFSDLVNLVAHVRYCANRLSPASNGGGTP